LTVSLIASTTFCLASVLRLSKSPISESNSLIALTIVDLSLVVKLFISEVFLPSAFFVYSAPKTSSLLSACKSTSLIASTTVFLLSVVS
jgi:hypothetical protein